MIKYKVDKDKYVEFYIQIHQTNLFNIGLPFERSFYFLGQGKAIIRPIVPPRVGTLQSGGASRGRVCHQSGYPV